MKIDLLLNISLFYSQGKIRMSKYYAVKNGKEGPKIYDNWNDCQRNVGGFSGAVHKSFRTLGEASAFLGLSSPIMTPITIAPTAPTATTATTPPITTTTPITTTAAAAGITVNTTNTNNPIDKYDRIIVYTDGSCTNLATDRAKAGSGIYFPQLGWEISLPVPGIQTHNRGELYAVIRALELIVELRQAVTCEAHSGGPKGAEMPVEIHIDATYVMNNIESNNKANLDLWVQLHSLLGQVKVIWVKELAHSGVYGNDRADALAKAIAFS